MRSTPGQPIDILSRALAYLLGGIFLCTAGGTGVLALMAHIVGGIFMGFAFFLVIVSLLNRFVAWTDSVHMYLFFALFVATLGSIMITAVGSGKPLYIVLAAIFSLLLVLALFFEIVRGCGVPPFLVPPTMRESLPFPLTV